MNYFEIINTFANLILALGAFFTVGVAWKGWKKEIRGQTEYKLAVDLLSKIYQLRNNLNSARNIFILNHEMLAEDQDDIDLLDGEAKHKGLSTAYQKRWNRVNKTRQEIDEILIRAEAVWGEKIKTLLNEYFDHTQDLFFAIQDYLEYEKQGISRMARPRKSAYEYDKEILYKGSSDNSYDEKQKEIINKLETFLKPKLKN